MQSRYEMKGEASDRQKKYQQKRMKKHPEYSITETKAGEGKGTQQDNRKHK